MTISSCRSFRTLVDRSKKWTLKGQLELQVRHTLPDNINETSEGDPASAENSGVGLGRQNCHGMVTLACGLHASHNVHSYHKFHEFLVLAL